jgi:hypothetical protein
VRWRASLHPHRVLAALGPLWALSLMAAAAPRATPLTGFISQPTEQLALPGLAPSGEITPQGDLYTGWAEYELSIGSPLRRWNQPTRVLPAPSVPRYVSRLVRDGVSYTQAVFTIPVAGQPVTYLDLTARDVGPTDATARVALALAYSRGPTITGFHGVPTGAYRYERPALSTGDGYFFQLGQAFDSSWSYQIDGRDVVRDGLLLARAPRDARILSTAPSGSPDGLHARQEYRRRLAPGDQATWSWQIPLRPPAAGAGADRALDAVGRPDAEARLNTLWRRQERGMTQITVPEKRVNAVYDANVAEMLQSRYRSPRGWVQAVNRLQYQSYWIRDSAVDTVALDQVGLHAAAAQNLAFLAHWQQPDGLYISRSGQQDGVGQALWELDEHALLANSPAFASQQLPHVTAAVDWIDRASASDSLGILPPSTVADDEFLAGAHITGDDVWAAVGLRSAVALARLAGQPTVAARTQAIDNRFEGGLHHALRRTFARTGHITPALDQPGGMDWGNYGLAYPLPIVAPGSPMVRATIRWERTHSREGLPTYAGELHDYLGFPVDEAELGSGDVVAALTGFYAELAHTTASGYGWEDGPTPYGRRDSNLNLTPHGTFSGQFVTLLRNLLVRDDGDAVDLLSGVSPAWLKAGDRIAVRDAPIHRGEISFRLSMSRSAASATMQWRRHGPADGALRWMLPYWVARARSATGRWVTRYVRLGGRVGSLTLRWSARAPALSAASAAASLNGAYRAHGRIPPLRPTSGW